MAGGEALYERYKDALKRGHVASLRGRLDEALDAYAEASSIAPERPTPHTSAGTALLRRRRPADALRYYEAALRLAPRDETALLGRAQGLAALDRRPEAADAFDALADCRAGAGKLADAVDAARRGLELAEGRDRRRMLERFIARLRASEPDEPGRMALERALRVLEGPAMSAGSGDGGAGPIRTAGAAEEDAIAAAVDGHRDGETAAVEPATEPGSATEAGSTVGAAPRDQTGEAATGEAGDATGEEAPADEVTADEPVVLVPPALDRGLPPDIGVDELTRRAEAALDAGDASRALEGFLDLASANRTLGQLSAAIDACYVALSLDPDHVGLHLALVQLYDDSGLAALATDKLSLLERLVTLDDDADGRTRVLSARAGRA